MGMSNYQAKSFEDLEEAVEEVKVSEKPLTVDEAVTTPVSEVDE